MQVLKRVSYQHFVLCTVNICRLLLLEVTLGLLLFPRGRPVVVKPSSHVAMRMSLNWVIRLANAHWGTPPFSGRRFSLLKRVRFGYGSLTNLFSTTLSIQANSRVQGLIVSAKRKPVHSFHRHVTTKSERVIAHVMGSNLLCLVPRPFRYVLFPRMRITEGSGNL